MPSPAGAPVSGRHRPPEAGETRNAKTPHCASVPGGGHSLGGQSLTDGGLVPHTESLRKRWLLFTFLMPPTGLPNQASREFMEAAIAYDQGLKEGLFTYHFLSGARPA